MPARCSAPNCRSGYDGEEPIPIFKMRDDFTDSEKDHWRFFLHRADNASLKHVCLCAKHFHPWEVLYTYEALLPDDWILVVNFTLCIFIRFQLLIVFHRLSLGYISRLLNAGFVIVYLFQ